MADLAARDALDGLDLPLAAGGCTLAALPPVPRLAIAPFCDRADQTAAALGLPCLPPPGSSAPTGGGRLLWAGLDLWLLEGAPGPDLAGLAAVADQSDAWAGLVLAGPPATDVLARLAPLDLAALPPGSVARSLLRHVPLLLVAVAGGFELLLPRSYAGAAADEIAHAMRAVAARAALQPKPAEAHAT